MLKNLNLTAGLSTQCRKNAWNTIHIVHFMITTTFCR